MIEDLGVLTLIKHINTMEQKFYHKMKIQHIKMKRGESKSR